MAGAARRGDRLVAPGAAGHVLRGREGQRQAHRGCPPARARRRSGRHRVHAVLAAGLAVGQDDRPARHRAWRRARRRAGGKRVGQGQPRRRRRASRPARQSVGRAQRRHAGRPHRHRRLRAAEQHAHARPARLGTVGRNSRQPPRAAREPARRHRGVRRRIGSRLERQGHLRRRRNRDHDPIRQAPLHRNGQRGRGEGRWRIRALPAAAIPGAACGQERLRRRRHDHGGRRRRDRARHHREPRAQRQGVGVAQSAGRQRSLRRSRGQGRRRAPVLRHGRKPDRHLGRGGDLAGLRRRRFTRARRHGAAAVGRHQRHQTCRSRRNAAFGRLRSCHAHRALRRQGRGGQPDHRQSDDRAARGGRAARRAHGNARRRCADRRRRLARQRRARRHVRRHGFAGRRRHHARPEGRRAGRGAAAGGLAASRRARRAVDQSRARQPGQCVGQRAFAALRRAGAEWHGQDRARRRRCRREGHLRRCRCSVAAGARRNRLCRHGQGSACRARPCASPSQATR